MMPTFLVNTERALMPWSGFLTGFFCMFAVRTFTEKQYIRSEILSYLTGTGLLGIVLWWYLPDRTPKDGALWVSSLAVGLSCMFVWYRFSPRFFERARIKLTKHSELERPGRTDVRSIADHLPKSQNEYDPRTFHREGDFFMGLDQLSKPLYWKGKLPHLAVVGTSGAGKGRKLQDIAAQSILNSEALVYLDPKGDEFGPHALYTACKENDKPYHYVSLLPDSPAQINILDGAKNWEIEELFTATLNLADSGKGSDHYKAKDRKAAHEAAAMASAENLTMSELYGRMSSDEYWVEEAPGFLDKLREMAGVSALNAKQSTFTLSDVVAHGGGVYVVGSMTLQPVKRGQQMVFVRIQQLATARDRMTGPLRTVCVIADETKYHISRPVLQGLGASRDRGMRVVLAFQSFADLRDCPADLNPEMVVGSVVENTPAKMIYRIEDPNTAEWLARRSGVILVDDGSRVLDKNIALAETASTERSIRQGEHFLFDTNKLTNLTAGYAVLFGQGIAKACYISPYRLEKDVAAITVTPALPPDSGVPNQSKQDCDSHIHRRKDFFCMEEQP